MRITDNINDDISKISNMPFVVVLGSGKSINDLTPEQLDLIEQANAKIAINKFAAFYELAKITPTHIYFHDDYTTSAILFLKYIFLKLRADSIANITFIVSKNYEGYLFKNIILFKMNFIFLKILDCILNFAIKVGRKILKPFSVNVFNSYKKFLVNELKNKSVLRNSLIPNKCKVQYVTIQEWNTKGNYWATQITQELYHYRGSFTSVLNYISIYYPNHNILLAGVDFNSFGYFFPENLLNNFPFKVSDWTTDLSRDNEKHFSVIDYEGTKMDDEFPFVINQLEKTGNKMYSLSKKSYLVENGFVEFIEI